MDSVGSNLRLKFYSEVMLQRKGEGAKFFLKKTTQVEVYGKIRLGESLTVKLRSKRTFGKKRLQRDEKNKKRNKRLHSNLRSEIFQDREMTEMGNTSEEATVRKCGRKISRPEI